MAQNYFNLINGFFEYFKKISKFVYGFLKVFDKNLK